ncbi:MAG: diaminopropionate ammonia-lyase [Chloroflexia bacterium]|nr:diaminopropionate ammonia-lyase [Chloroflexia bacterium]
MSAQSSIFYNSAASESSIGNPPGRDPLDFHRRLSGYEPTALIDAPALAENLGIGRVWVKDESSRLGLPAFKILGASWAIYSELQKRADLDRWNTIDELAALLEGLQPMTLSAATDGNHGRAVARMAALLGFDATIYVPAGTSQARIDAITSEDASVTVVDGTYDEAVARSAEDAGERCLVISDTSWTGYEDVPRRVIDGYSTILWEVDDQLAKQSEAGPDIVVVQIGVGALASAVVSHYRQSGRGHYPRIVGVEPTVANCMLASMRAGEIVTIPGPQDSIMAGLNCGTPSMLAWPVVSAGVDVFVEIDDDRAREAMRSLAGVGVVAGETGAAGLGGLIELLVGPEAEQGREFLGVNAETRVLLFVTEGATDPESYAEIVGRQDEPLQ